MKTLIVCFFALWVVILDVSVAVSGDCYSDTIVKRWLEERDRAEEHVVQVWAKGASPEEFAPEVAVILSNEFYVCSKCRDQEDFLKGNLHVLGRGSNPKVETVPGMILEHLVGREMLSPWSQFPSDRRREVTKR